MRLSPNLLDIIKWFWDAHSNLSNIMLVHEWRHANKVEVKNHFIWFCEYFQTIPFKSVAQPQIPWILFVLIEKKEEDKKFSQSSNKNQP